MIRSMTAFARKSRSGPWGELTWEIRSVNHRYLEPSPRLPEDLRALEPQVREQVRGRLARGKVDCSLRWRRDPGAGTELALNRALAHRVIELCEAVEGMHPRPAPLDALALLAWPGVVEQPEPDLDPVRAAALELLDEALDELVATREREGQRLKAVIVDRVQRAREIVTGLQAHLPGLRQRLHERLRAQLAALEVEAEPGRLEQEIALQLTRMDVDEEVDRLLGHLEEVAQVLDRDEPVGRRLDFLMQELNREANTLGSKSAGTEAARAAVELKVLIEQMREQVQNIE